MASAPPKSSMCWPRKRCWPERPGTCWCRCKAISPRASRPRTSPHIEQTHIYTPFPYPTLFRSAEVEPVLATQTLLARKARNRLVQVQGHLAPGITAKDLVLAIIGHIGTAGGTGYTIEFAGPAVRSLSMEGRMTICNMAIEAGARAGLVAVDDKTIDYVKGRPLAPDGVEWEQA